MAVTVRQQARADAAQILRDYWDGSLPVDPFKIANQLGMEVQITSLKDGISGAIIADGKSSPKILIEAAESYGRKTFTCAHEIGHYVDRRRVNDAQYSFVDQRAVLGPRDGHEIYADEFAANLLMPEERFRELYAEYESDRMMAAEFGVSVSAARVRRERLGIAQ